MTEANPQPSKEKETREPVYLEHWYRACKMKNSIHLKTAKYCPGGIILNRFKFLHKTYVSWIVRYHIFVIQARYNKGLVNS